MTFTRMLHLLAAAPRAHGLSAKDRPGIALNAWDRLGRR